MPTTVSQTPGVHARGVTPAAYARVSVHAVGYELDKAHVPRPEHVQGLEVDALHKELAADAGCGRVKRVWLLIPSRLHSLAAHMTFTRGGRDAAPAHALNLAAPTHFARSTPSSAAHGTS